MTQTDGGKIVAQMTDEQHAKFMQEVHRHNEEMQRIATMQAQASMKAAEFMASPPAPEVSLRDWFAGQALTIAWDARDKGYFDGDDADMAKCAYQVADAMIAARDAK